MAQAPQTLKDLYTADLRDLMSGNNQMQTLLQQFQQKASNDGLKRLFERSVNGIQQHTQRLQQLAGTSSESICKGMQGLIEEAKQHALEADLPAPLRDLELIAQYQRMSHYGITGFGTAASYAEALGLQEQAQQLRKVVSDIYAADEISSQLAHTVQQAAASA